MNRKWIVCSIVWLAACSNGAAPEKSTTGTNANNDSIAGDVFDSELADVLAEAHCGFLATCTEGDVVSAADCVASLDLSTEVVACEVFRRSVFDECVAALDSTCQGTGENYPPVCEDVWDRSTCCYEDAMCGGATPFCDLGTQLCVACRAGGDCPSESPGCDSQGECTSCEAIGAVPIEVDGDIRCSAGCESGGDCGSFGYECLRGGCLCAPEKREVQINGELMCLPRCVNGACDAGFQCSSGLCVPT